MGCTRCASHAGSARPRRCEPARSPTKAVGAAPSARSRRPTPRRHRAQDDEGPPSSQSDQSEPSQYRRRSPIPSRMGREKTGRVPSGGRCARDTGPGRRSAQSAAHPRVFAPAQCKRPAEASTTAVRGHADTGAPRGVPGDRRTSLLRRVWDPRQPERHVWLLLLSNEIELPDLMPYMLPLPPSCTYADERQSLPDANEYSEARSATAIERRACQSAGKSPQRTMANSAARTSDVRAREMSTFTLWSSRSPGSSRSEE